MNENEYTGVPLKVVAKSMVELRQHMFQKQVYILLYWRKTPAESSRGVIRSTLMFPLLL